MNLFNPEGTLNHEEALIRLAHWVRVAQEQLGQGKDLQRALGSIKNLTELMVREHERTK